MKSSQPTLPLWDANDQIPGPAPHADELVAQVSAVEGAAALPSAPVMALSWQTAVSEASLRVREIDEEWSYAPHQTRTQKLRQLLSIRQIARKYRINAGDLRHEVLYEPERRPWGEDETSGLLEEFTGKRPSKEAERTARTVPNGYLIRNHRRAASAVELAKEKQRIL